MPVLERSFFVGVPWVNDRWLVEQSERALNFCSVIKDYDFIDSNVFLVKLKLRLPKKVNSFPTILLLYTQPMR